MFIRFDESHKHELNFIMKFSNVLVFLIQVALHSTTKLMLFTFHLIYFDVYHVIVVETSNILKSSKSGLFDSNLKEKKIFQILVLMLLIFSPSR